MCEGVVPKFLVGRENFVLMAAERASSNAWSHSAPTLRRFAHQTLGSSSKAVWLHHGTVREIIAAYLPSGLRWHCNCLSVRASRRRPSATRFA